MKPYRELWHNHSKSWFEEILPENDQKILVQAEYSLISQGTERLVISDHISENTAPYMKVPYMKGEFNVAFTYGYSLVGKIIKGSSNLLNKYVHLLHPHQEIAQVTHSDLYFFDNLEPSIATLASNTETAINAVWDAQLNDSENILIIGYGLIGALVAMVAKELYSANVFIYDTNSERCSLAESHGFNILQKSMDDSFPVAINTSAHESGLQMAIDKTGYEGKIIEMSWYGSRKVSLNLGGSFHYQRKKIICSQVSNIPSHKKPEWDYKKRKDLVFDILRKCQPSHLLDRTISFDETPSFFDKLRLEEKISDFSVIIKY